ncbi:alpha/beta hydrolase [Streptomyces sp. NPDC093252]|uniref:alpha/beta hydrolase n=1 Tax=Streptomyces sp. NPDC093252 TaxID=3154980 RepID=UPI0034226073
MIGAPRLPGPATAPLPQPRTRSSGGGARLIPEAVYAVIPGHRPLTLDLYLPEAHGPAPVIVHLHGGGWRLGSRREFGPAFDGVTPDPWTVLTRAGFAVAAVEYRLSGEATFPAQLHDVKAAVRWLRHRRDELGLDTEHIIAFGESAGGHLAALLGLTPGHPALEGTVGVTGPSSQVTAVIDWYGPTDLLTLSRPTPPPAAPSREALLLGSPVDQVPELARLASPVTHVSAAAPPFHIAHGTHDLLVPSSQSRTLATALRAAGVPVDLHLVEGGGHLWAGTDDAAPLLDRAVAFARSVLP